MPSPHSPDASNQIPEIRENPTAAPTGTRAPEIPRSNSIDAKSALDAPEQTERRRQVRGLLLIAVLVIVFSVLRAGIHRVFTVGWWRLW